MAAFPNVTAIPVRDVLERVIGVVDRIAVAVRLVALFVLGAGFTVMAEALAQSRAQRLYESVLLRTLGATRGRVARAFAVEYGCLGLGRRARRGRDRRRDGGARAALRPRRARRVGAGARRHRAPGAPSRSPSRSAVSAPSGCSAGSPCPSSAASSRRVRPRDSPRRAPARPGNRPRASPRIPRRGAALASRPAAGAGAPPGRSSPHSVRSSRGQSPGRAESRRGDARDRRDPCERPRECAALRSRDGPGSGGRRSSSAHRPVSAPAAPRA